MSVRAGGLTGRHLIASVFQVTSVLHGDHWHIGHKHYSNWVWGKKENIWMEILCYLSINNKAQPSITVFPARKSILF